MDPDVTTTTGMDVLKEACMMRKALYVPPKIAAMTMIVARSCFLPFSVILPPPTWIQVCR
jgi:hypothetical protein